MGDAIHVAVVGGGITGLAAAHAVVTRARERRGVVTVTVLEASPRFGGNLRSEIVDGFVVDAGPDSWVATKPRATALACELGLRDALIGTRPEARRYYVAWRDELHPVPDGLVLGVPTRVVPLVASRLFSWPGKLRMALEPFVPRRRWGAEDDESIADFATRRLGREASDRLVAPLLGGISAGDARTLSVRAAFPQLVAMEREHGSLVRGMLAARRSRAKAAGPAVTLSGVGGSTFVSLRGGVGSLADALTERLRKEGVDLRLGARVTEIVRTASGYRLAVEGSDPLEAGRVLLAAPAHAAARAVAGVDEAAAAALRDIGYASTATVFLAYRAGAWPRTLDGSGFVVPPSLRRPILAGTWVSSKWAGRAPDGYVLVRAFFGGASGEEALARDDADLAALARSELRALMGGDPEPLWHRVYRWDRASAQMRVGHIAAMRRLRARLAEHAPGLHVAGGGYDGVGIPDCIRQGQEAAAALLA